MNILLITDELLPGGISRHVVDLANALAARVGWNVHVAATPGAFLSRMDSRIHFVPLHLLRQNSYSKDLSGILPAIGVLSTAIAHHKIEIIHTHKRYSHLFGKLLSLRYGIPHVTSYHSLVQKNVAPSFLGDFTICCSNAVREHLIRSFHCSESRSATVYPSVHPFPILSAEEQQEARRQLGIDDGVRIVSSVGQFVEEKDRASLITAAAMLLSRGRKWNIRFILMGHGEQREELEKLSERLQVKDAIQFIDGDYDAGTLFSISEFTILNSRTEGFGMVMLEAASTKKITIGTNVGGIPEFIENGVTGLLIEKNNPSQLTDAIQFLLENPEKRTKMEDNAREKFDSMFSFHNMIDNTLEIYKKVTLSKGQ